METLEANLTGQELILAAFGDDEELTTDIIGDRTGMSVNAVSKRLNGLLKWEKVKIVGVCGRRNIWRKNGAD